MEAIKKVIKKSRNIVFFGGAGTSTESGIPDFRSAQGLYNRADGTTYPPEQILSRSFFDRYPEDFFVFYRKYMLYPDAQPNPAHTALAQLEKLGKLQAVITQNIDGLHQRAGSQKVLELHGSVERNYCMDCGSFYSLSHVLKSVEIVPRCLSCGGMVKPDVVLYEESLHLPLLESAIDYIAQAEVLIVAGTSLTVHPAAGLIRYYQGDCLVLINRSETPFDSVARYVLNDSVAEVLPQWVDAH
ncbi:NAD-dependent protein deacylase [Paenibacillus senegalensis]|uniref:NAD-dependent protein deacylase n=1 Tax=Paenibacillus senegalensis TaxID=1465766 RepID=UPI0002897569|nr:NAD-dependent protein deacylase [Paenibacillus senegalensis]